MMNTHQRKMWNTLQTSIDMETYTYIDPWNLQCVIENYERTTKSQSGRILVMERHLTYKNDLK